MLTKGLKKVAYILLELTYIAAMAYILLYIKGKYNIGGNYDEPLFWCVFIGMILVNLFLWAPLNKIVSMIYVFIFSVYVIAQHIYFLAFHQYFRLATAFSLFKEVVGESASAAEFVTKDDIWPLIFIVVVSLAYFILFFIFQRKSFKFYIKLAVSALSLVLITQIQTYYNQFLEALEASKNYDAFQMNESEFFIYDTMPSTNQVVEKFGLLAFAHKDVITFYETEDFTSNNKQKVEDFLANLPDHNKNEMTGIFEGKNLFIIQAESFNHIALDPVLTPNIYKLATQGINIKGFNTPSLPGSTSDTEVMANLSLIPNTEGYATSHKYATNSFDVTLADLFNNQGYQTEGIHNNYKIYYNRENMFNTYKYSRFLDCTEFYLDDTQEDTTIADCYIRYYLGKAPSKTMDYWITYSGHQPYSLDSVAVREEYVNKIKQVYPDLSDEYVAYLAKNMNLDDAVGQLLSALEAYGRLDNTVIIFFGDHMVKGLDFSEGSNFYAATGKQYNEHDLDTDLYIYNSEYSRNHGPLEFNKVSTSLDLLPTIANMWNMEYDTKKVMGRDIFDPEYKGFFFAEYQAWKTDDWAYDPVYNTFYYCNNMSEEDALKEYKYYEQMREVCRLIFKFNYFKK